MAGTERAQSAALLMNHCRTASLPLKAVAVLLLGLTILIQLSLRPSHAAPTTSSQYELLRSIGGAVMAVAVEGSVAYLGEGSTFASFDISNPAEVSRLSTVMLPDMVHEIVLAGDLAYLADGFGGLRIVAISDPASLNLVGSYSVAGGFDNIPGAGFYNLLVAGDKLYISGARNGAPMMQIIDVSDPTAPALLGSYTPDSYLDFTALAIRGTFVYLSSRYGIYVIDVAISTAPRLANVINS